MRAPRNLSAVLAAQFRMLEITAILLEAAAELPRHHADPIDRVLIAHALEDDLGVLTRDGEFARCGVGVAPAASPRPVWDDARLRGRHVRRTVVADESSRSKQDVARALGDSALAGGVVGVLVAAAAFLAARFARLRRRRRR